MFGRYMTILGVLNFLIALGIKGIVLPSSEDRPSAFWDVVWLEAFVDPGQFSYCGPLASCEVSPVWGRFQR
jgi:hypothetical protein